jgi:hypothetical protein
MNATTAPRLYRVEIDTGRQVWSSLHHGRSPSAAVYDAFLDTDLNCTFGDYLKAYKPRARLAGAYPAPDGYDYVRRAYGVDPRIGQRVRLCNEASLSGKEGVVLYPGTSSAYVHVLLDGEKSASHVHPSNVTLLDNAPTAEAG